MAQRNGGPHAEPSGRRRDGAARARPAPQNHSSALCALLHRAGRAAGALPLAAGRRRDCAARAHSQRLEPRGADAAAAAPARSRRAFQQFVPRCALDAPGRSSESVRGESALPFISAAARIRVSAAAGAGAGKHSPCKPLSGHRVGARRSGLGRRPAGVPAFARSRRTAAGDHRALRAPEAADRRLGRRVRGREAVAVGELRSGGPALGRSGRHRRRARQRSRAEDRG